MAKNFGGNSGNAKMGELVAQLSGHTTPIGLAMYGLSNGLPQEQLAAGVEFLTQQMHAQQQATAAAPADEPQTAPRMSAHERLVMAMTPYAPQMGHQRMQAVRTMGMPRGY